MTSGDQTSALSSRTDHSRIDQADTASGSGNGNGIHGREPGAAASALAEAEPGPRGAEARSGAGSPTSRTVADLAKVVEAVEVIGRDDLRIDGLETLDLSTQHDLTFIGSDRHAARWAASSAGAALVTRGLRVPDHDPAERALVIVEDADLAMAKVLSLFAPPPAEALGSGISPHATVHPEASVHPSAYVAAGVRIGRGAKIGANTVLEENVVVGPLVTIGEDCVLRAGAVIRERCEIGNRVSIHPNAVIGADGFGYRPDGRGGLIKIPHIGIVIVHDDAEIGACVTIDRAKFGRTEIGPHTKLDNLVQIGHNVRMGRGCALSAQAGIAGSTTVGDFVLMGGKAGLADHIRIGNRVKVAAYTGVMRDADDGEILAGTPAMPARLFWRLQAALYEFAGLPKSALSRRG